MSRFFKSAAFPIIVVVVLALVASKWISNNSRTDPPTFSGFLAQLESGQVDEATLRTKDNSIDVRTDDGKKYEVGYPADYSPNLVLKLRQAEAQGDIETFDVKPARTNVLVSVLTYVLPLLIFFGFWIFIMNQVQGGGSKVMSFGKSRA